MRAMALLVSAALVFLEPVIAASVFFILAIDEIA